jgi:L-lactate dehydrogenase complex protein LldE
LHVSLFITCYNDTLFPESGRAVVRVLERLGHTVVFPAGQTCCGQLHTNTGYRDEALPLVVRFVEQFRDAEAIVAPSSSCVMMIREQYPNMAAELETRYPGIIAAVHDLLPCVYEFCEFLTKRLQLTSIDAYYPHRVTYHASCHGLRGLALGGGPEQLLQSVRGIELVELPNLERCCGFGGTFAVKNSAVSGAMLAEKVRDVLNTNCEVCTACDNSCLMHINGALHRQRTGVKTIHIAEILASEHMGSA